MYFLIPLANMNTYVAFAIVCQFLSYILRQASLNQWRDIMILTLVNSQIIYLSAYSESQLICLLNSHSFSSSSFLSLFLSRNERRLWHKHAASAANRGTTIINHHHATTTTTTTTTSRTTAAIELQARYEKFALIIRRVSRIRSSSSSSRLC